MSKRSKRYKKQKTPSKSPRFVELFESIEKLIKSELVNIDLVKPSVFLSLNCYKALCCDDSGIFVDEKKALGFLNNLRFFINFKRAYLSGMRQGLIEDALGEELATKSSETAAGEKMWVYPIVEAEEAINLYVASSDGESILLYGAYDDKTLTLRPYEKNVSSRGQTP